MTPLALGLSICAAVIGPLAVMCWFFVKAPRGWEDCDGFHFGEPDERGDNDNWGA